VLRCGSLLWWLEQVGSRQSTSGRCRSRSRELGRIIAWARGWCGGGYCCCCAGGVWWGTAALGTLLHPAKALGVGGVCGWKRGAVSSFASRAPTSLANGISEIREEKEAPGITRKWRASGSARRANHRVWGPCLLGRPGPLAVAKYSRHGNRRRVATTERTARLQPQARCTLRCTSEGGFLARAGAGSLGAQVDCGFSAFPLAGRSAGIGCAVWQAF
jgi:hypothetical protein